jgi:oxygen-independent coproporphyrinogen-3 oxidase
MAAATLGIYVQVPFCASKCSFCNFSSRVEPVGLFDRYTTQLVRELKAWAGSFAARGIPPETLHLPVDSLYVGGGTPTLLGETRLASLNCSLQECLGWTDDVEFTFETTPGSATEALLQALGRLGVNRLSIGAQTFDDQELRAVGRLHSVEDSLALVRQAREAGFQNVSLDLIAGLPYQTRETFRRSLEIAVSLRPEHVSLYLFEIDEKSRLGREVMQHGERYHAAAVPGEEFMADAYEAGCAFLAREGYRQYEISNFALPGFESRHNRKYWELAPYVGLGAGAHSFDGVRRWSNHVSVQDYLAKLDSDRDPIDDLRTLTSTEQVEEFFFLGLRQVEGIDLGVARTRWGADCLRPWESHLSRLVDEHWLIRDGDHIRLARHAYLVSNEIFQEFVKVLS